MASTFVLASAQNSQHLPQEPVLTEAVNLGKPLTPEALTRGVRQMLAH